jgi:hypothetical protein
VVVGSAGAVFAAQKAENRPSEYLRESSVAEACFPLLVYDIEIEL